MNVGTVLRKWREGKVRPIPGNPPHDRLVSRVISSSLKESLRRSLPRHCLPQLQKILGAQYAFGKAWRNLSVRCGQTTTKPWGGTAPPPDGRLQIQVEERVGRTTFCSSSAMSSDRLFLDRVARQHCPSPLHRQAQTTTVPPPARPKPDISTLQRIGHFYFALTGNGVSVQWSFGGRVRSEELLNPRCRGISRRRSKHLTCGLVRDMEGAVVAEWKQFLLRGNDQGG